MTRSDPADFSDKLRHTDCDCCEHAARLIREHAAATALSSREDQSPSPAPVSEDDIERVALAIRDVQEKHRAPASGGGEGWFNIADQLPPLDTPVVVRKKWDDGSYLYVIDEWVEHRDQPVSFSSVTVPAGTYWRDSDPMEATEWKYIDAPSHAAGMRSALEKEGWIEPMKNLLRQLELMPVKHPQQIAEREQAKELVGWSPAPPHTEGRK